MPTPPASDATPSDRPSDGDSSARPPHSDDVDHDSTGRESSDRDTASHESHESPQGTSPETSQEPSSHAPPLPDASELPDSELRDSEPSPESPSQKSPSAEASEVEAPEVEAPEVEAPEVEAPEVEGEANVSQRLHPLTLLLRMLASLPAFAFLLLPILTNPSSGNYFSLFLSILFGALAIPAIVLRYMRFSYRIAPKQIVIQQGVINRQNRSIPIERVQNVQIEQNVVARLFGIAKVKIETAGSSATEGTLEYVGLDKAHEIRSVVRSFQRQQVAAAPEPTTPDPAPEPTTPDPAPNASDAPTTSPAAAPASTRNGADVAADAWDADAAETLFTMSLGRTLLSGAFRFSLLYIALIFSVLQFFEPDALVNWVLRERGHVDAVMNSIYAHPAIALLATVVVAAFFGWMSGILLHLNRYYGFRLWVDGDKLRKRHGLFTVTEGTIPLSKVQALILKTNPLMRALGWYELEVQTIGLDVNEQGHRVLAPFASRSDVLALAQHIRPFHMPEAFTPVSPLTIRRTFVRYTVALTALVVPTAYFWPGDWWHPFDVALPWWGFALIPFIAGWAYLQYRYHGYSVEDDGFYIRRGVLSHFLWVIPTEKFHVFYSTASVFQRRLDLKTLFVDTAGAAAFAYPEVVDLPDGAADEALQRLHDQFHTLYRHRLEAATGSPTTRLSEEQRPHLPEE